MTSPDLAPIVCFVGLSNSGKTTLVARVIAALSQAGLRVGALKHSSHGFTMDRPGKDTHRFRDAGAYAVGIASKTEQAVIQTADEPTLDDLVSALPSGLDIIVCEGFSGSSAPKIGVHRAEAPLPAGLNGLIAVVGDGSPYAELPQFDSTNVPAICEFIRSDRSAGSPSRRKS